MWHSMRCLGFERYCKGIVTPGKVQRICLAYFISNLIQATYARTTLVKEAEHKENGAV